MLWLTIFFVVPLGFLAYQSLQSGNFDVGYSFTWAWGNYWNAIRDYRPQFIRSIEYAGMATLLAFVLSYPVAYWIAFRGGRWKNLLLLFIVAPFFVTYLIRTLAWETILSDHGFVVRTLQHLHVLGAGGRLLATSTAVVAGITYNFLPFMALPLYVSLEQIDQRLLEAAEDLYASKWKAFIRITLPLSQLRGGCYNPRDGRYNPAADRDKIAEVRNRNARRRVGRRDWCHENRYRRHRQAQIYFKQGGMAVSRADFCHKLREFQDLRA